MLDFKELPIDGNDFELLIRELLFSMGLNVYWSGKGADGGIDLLCIERPYSILMSKEQRWLVQCKHKAHSGESVGIKELDDIVVSCAQHHTGGYLLVCSTYPSSAVVQRIKKIDCNPTFGISVTYWDSATIERMLSTPKTWPIAQRFFPISANADGWKIYATEFPNHWIVNYKGYYFHLSNRIGSTAEMHLDSIRQRIGDIESIELPEKHFIRPRAVFYEDNNGCYTWFIDYLYPINDDAITPPFVIKSLLGDGYVLEDSQLYSIDLYYHQYNGSSDHYDPDHYDYYLPYQNNFNLGMSRKKQYFIEFHGKDTFPGDGEYEHQWEYKAFHDLVEVLKNIDFIRIIRSVNSKIEDIDKFYFLFDWSEVISELKIEPDLFFSARVRFICNDFNKLINLLNQFPQKSDTYFSLKKVLVFLPEKGFESESDSLYDLDISIHPYLARNKFLARKAINEYFNELTNVIVCYLKNYPNQ